MTASRDGEGASAAPNGEPAPALDWAAVRGRRDCQDRDDIFEWKKPGGFLHVEDRLPWLIAEHEAEEGDE